MKLATIINPSKSIKITIIIDNTIYNKKTELVRDSHFKLQQPFFDFVNSLTNGPKIGNIEDCLVVIIDTNDVNNFFNPLNDVINTIYKLKNNEMINNENGIQK